MLYSLPVWCSSSPELTLKLYGLDELFCLLSKARQNMFIGNNQRQWEDVYNTNTIRIRKLKKNPKHPKIPQFRNILISHCIRILHFASPLLITDHPGQTGGYIHPQLIDPAHFACVLCWTGHVKMEGMTILGNQSVVFSYLQICQGESFISWRSIKC